MSHVGRARRRNVAAPEADDTIDAGLGSLSRLPIGELRAVWRERLGGELPRVRSRSVLAHRHRAGALSIRRKARESRSVRFLRLASPWEAEEHGQHQVVPRESHYRDTPPGELEENAPVRGRPPREPPEYAAVQRPRPTLGLTVLRDLRRTGDKTWEDGKVCDPDDGADYGARMSIDEDGTLHVRAYVLLPIFGKTLVFTPVR